uniref:CUB domain-containing protein n=1 Tax=Panagrellus redivivus TaxID=6233 RepID=A0A7E4VGR3_PANRE
MSLFMFVLFYVFIADVNAKLVTVESPVGLPDSLKSIVKLGPKAIIISPSSIIYRIAITSHQLPIENAIHFHLSFAKLKPETREKCLSDTTSRPFELTFGNETHPECTFQFTWSISTDATTRSSITTSSMINSDGTINGNITTQPGTEIVNLRLIRDTPLSIIWPKAKTHEIPMGPGPVISGISDDSDWLPVTTCFPETYVEDGLRLLNVRFVDLNYPNCDWRLIFENVKLVMPSGSVGTVERQKRLKDYAFLIAFFGLNAMVGGLVVFLTVSICRKTHPKVPPMKP